MHYTTEGKRGGRKEWVDGGIGGHGGKGGLKGLSGHVFIAQNSSSGVQFEVRDRLDGNGGTGGTGGNGGKKGNLIHFKVTHTTVQFFVILPMHFETNFTTTS